MKASALGHDRLLFADAVRAVAIILVVVIHVSAPPVVHQAISLSHTWCCEPVRLTGQARGAPFRHAEWLVAARHGTAGITTFVPQAQNA